MRYRLELEIYRPRDRVLELFLDPRNLPRWQPDLVSFDPVSAGKARDVGTKTRQVHKMGGREVEILETITVRDYPDRFCATYEADNVWNLVENRFIDVGGRKTRWILDSEFRCKGVAMNLMSFLLPGMFKKQTVTFMKRFKEFAERSGNE